MSSKTYKLGSLLTLVNIPCGISNLTVEQISGVNREKEFFSPAKQAGADTSKYKKVPPRHFACNLMHVGRDAVLPIALNDSEETLIVSPAYTVFSVIDEEILLPEFFFMFLNSNERDRYFTFVTDSSVRDGLSWDILTDIELAIPAPEVQKNAVEIYRSIDQSIRDTYAQIQALNFAIKAENARIASSSESKYKTIGSLISLVDELNEEGTSYPFLGMNREKQFMPTVAATSTLDAKKYKLLRKNRFAFTGMQTGRDVCIRIALYSSDEPALISPAYTTFRISDSGVLPEYFYTLFLDSEMDRLGWFLSDTSIRSNLDWPEFCSIRLPIPDWDTQVAISNLKAAVDRSQHDLEHMRELKRRVCPVVIAASLAKTGE